VESAPDQAGTYDIHVSRGRHDGQAMSHKGRITVARCKSRARGRFNSTDESPVINSFRTANLQLLLRRALYKARSTVYGLSSVKGRGDRRASLREVMTLATTLAVSGRQWP